MNGDKDNILLGVSLYKNRQFIIPKVAKAAFLENPDKDRYGCLLAAQESLLRRADKVVVGVRGGDSQFDCE
jgi:hypothetical protein